MVEEGCVRYKGEKRGEARGEWMGRGLGRMGVGRMV